MALEVIAPQFEPQQSPPTFKARRSLYLMALEDKSAKRLNSFSPEKSTDLRDHFEWVLESKTDLQEIYDWFFQGRNIQTIQALNYLVNQKHNFRLPIQGNDLQVFISSIQGDFDRFKSAMRMYGSLLNQNTLNRFRHEFVKGQGKVLKVLNSESKASESVKSKEDPPAVSYADVSAWPSLKMTENQDVKKEWVKFMMSACLDLLNPKSKILLKNMYIKAGGVPPAILCRKTGALAFKELLKEKPQHVKLLSRPEVIASLSTTNQGRALLNSYEASRNQNQFEASKNFMKLPLNQAFLMACSDDSHMSLLYRKLRTIDRSNKEIVQEELKIVGAERLKRLTESRYGCLILMVLWLRGYTNNTARIGWIRRAMETPEGKSLFDKLMEMSPSDKRLKAFQDKYGKMLNKS